MWLRAGAVVSLFFASLALGSAEDDGPPAYTPRPIDYADPLLMPTNPPPPSAVANPQSGYPWEGEPFGRSDARSEQHQKATPSWNK
jgi:hypothetical protein